MMYFAVKTGVRGLVLMTYDYSVNRGKQGPNAPFDWLTQLAKDLDKRLNGKYANRVMIGLNFYGYRFEGPQGVEAVIGDQMVELMKKEGDDWQWEWDKESMEHVLVHKEDATKRIFYPTLNSVAMRIEMVSIETKFGISIWELGQGMEYFTDLL